MKPFNLYVVIFTSPLLANRQGLKNPKVTR